jgi:HK97 family phage major capsid protein
MGKWETKDSGSVPAEIRDLFDGFKRDIKELREKHEQEMREVKKAGSADVVIRDQVKRMETGVENLKKDIDALFKRMQRPQITGGDVKSVELEQKANLAVAAWIGSPGDAEKGAAARVAYKHAFNVLSRRGKDALSADEVKTLSVGSAPDGGFYVEPQRADFIVQRLRETSAMRNLATVMTITAPSLKIPVDRDDVGFEWVGEQSTRNATNTAQVGEMEIPVHEVSAMPKVTQNMLDDAGFDVEGWLNQKIVDRFGRAENTAFVSGNGTSRPRGFLTGTPVTTADASRAFGALQYIATGTSGAFATASATVSPADKLLDLIYSFNAGYRGSLAWAMNRTTLAAIRKFKNQDGDFIYDPRLGANGIIDMVLGYRVEEFADMADFTTANSFAIALGDWKRGYLIVDKQGMRQLRDPFTDKPRVLFYTTKRVGGAVVDSDAIKLLRFGAS